MIKEENDSDVPIVVVSEVILGENPEQSEFKDESDSFFEEDYNREYK